MLVRLGPQESLREHLLRFVTIKPLPEGHHAAGGGEPGGGCAPGGGGGGTRPPVGMFASGPAPLLGPRLLCAYNGNVCTEEELQEHERRANAEGDSVVVFSHTFDLQPESKDAAKQLVVDAAPWGGAALCAAGAVNDVLGSGKQHPNAVFVDAVASGMPGIPEGLLVPLVFLVTLEQLQPGEEVLVSYGEAYWRCRDKLSAKFRAQREKEERRRSGPAEPAAKPAEVARRNGCDCQFTSTQGRRKRGLCPAICPKCSPMNVDAAAKGKCRYPLRASSRMSCGGGGAAAAGGSGSGSASGGSGSGTGTKAVEDSGDDSASPCRKRRRCTPASQQERAHSMAEGSAAAAGVISRLHASSPSAKADHAEARTVKEDDPSDFKADVAQFDEAAAAARGGAELPAAGAAAADAAAQVASPARSCSGRSGIGWERDDPHRDLWDPSQDPPRASGEPPPPAAGVAADAAVLGQGRDLLPLSSLQRIQVAAAVVADADAAEAAAAAVEAAAAAARAAAAKVTAEATEATAVALAKAAAKVAALQEADNARRDAAEAVRMAEATAEAEREDAARERDRKASLAATRVAEANARVATLEWQLAEARQAADLAALDAGREAEADVSAEEEREAQAQLRLEQLRREAAAVEILAAGILEAAEEAPDEEAKDV